MSCLFKRQDQWRGDRGYHGIPERTSYREFLGIAEPSIECVFFTEKRVGLLTELARQEIVVKALKVAKAFPYYSPEEALQMPLAKILFLHSSIQVMEGSVLPEKHLSQEEELLVQTAEDMKDDLKGVLDEIRGVK